MIKVAVVGCGYWGPNLIRNFVACPLTELAWVYDRDPQKMDRATRMYPGVKKAAALADIINDADIAAVAIATPVNTHFEIARACLEGGKHVLLEKPLASSVEQGEELVRLARERGLQLMCDHTFCYTGAVRKMKEVIDSGALGDVLYFDSIRINLGLFQQDVNVIWDLAPHDLSILDFLVGRQPSSVSAHGIAHTGNDLENIAYVTLKYPGNLIAHFHVNWLSPVKIRRTIIGGSEKMLVWDDLEPGETIKIYDKGIIVKRGEEEMRNRLLVSYRSADMYAPRVDDVEALALMIREFAEAIENNRQALTDGEAGLRVLRILEATQRSIKADGANVQLS
jgi:predicted dehydrogenase